MGSHYSGVASTPLTPVWLSPAQQPRFGGLETTSCVPCGPVPSSVPTVWPVREARRTTGSGRLRRAVPPQVTPRNGLFRLGVILGRIGRALADAVGLVEKVLAVAQRRQASQLRAYPKANPRAYATSTAALSKSLPHLSPPPSHNCHAAFTRSFDTGAVEDNRNQGGSSDG